MIADSCWPKVALSTTEALVASWSNEILNKDIKATSTTVLDNL